MDSDHKIKFEAVDALRDWARHFRDKNHPVALTLFRAAAIIVQDIQILKNFAAGGGTVDQASNKLPSAPGGDACCQCRAFMDAQLAGTDNEAYGSLIRKSNDGWKIGCDLPPMQFCPWCGLTTPIDEPNDT